MEKTDLNIFIIDDTPEVANTIYEYLLTQGYEHVQTFYEPKKAYQEICRKRINFNRCVIITDQRMPEMTGEKLLEFFQSIVPVKGVIITSEPESVTTNIYPIFEKGSPSFFDKLRRYLENLIG